MNAKSAHGSWIRNLVYRSALLFAALQLSTTSATSAEFIPLGVVPESSSYDVTFSSADGSVLLGAANNYAGTADAKTFRWTRDTGSIEWLDAGLPAALSADGSTLGFYDGRAGQTQLWSEATGYRTIDFEVRNMNSDGSVIVGFKSDAGFDSNGPAKWTADSGITVLPNPLSSRGGIAEYVSPDGSVIAGGIRDTQGCTLCFKPFRWTAAEGTKYLGEDPEHELADTYGLSDDGSTVVGISWAGNRGGGALWRWTEESGFQVIAEEQADALYGFNATFLATRTVDERALSADGNVIAGYRGKNNDYSVVEAFRWTEATGIEVIPGLPAFPVSYVTDMSADGSILLGGSYDQDTSDVKYWLWTEPTGTLSLSEILAQQGIGEEAAGWKFHFLGLEIADDGNAIFGSGTNPDGIREGLVIYLDPLTVPEPSSLMLATIALAGLLTARRRSSLGLILAREKHRYELAQACQTSKRPCTTWISWGPP